MLISRQHYPLVFATLTIILLITEWFITQSQSFQLRSDALSLGVTVDVALGVPVLYYLLVVRTGRWSKTSLVAVLGASVGLAKWLLPANGQMYVNGIAQVLPLLELGVLGYLAYHGVAVLRVYRAHRQHEPDFVLNLQQSLTDVTGRPKLSQLIAGEAAVFRYGLLAGLVGQTKRRGGAPGVYLAPNIGAGGISHRDHNDHRH